MTTCGYSSQSTTTTSNNNDRTCVIRGDPAWTSRLSALHRRTHWQPNRVSLSTSLTPDATVRRGPAASGRGEALTAARVMGWWAAAGRPARDRCGRAAVRAHLSARVRECVRACVVYATFTLPVTQCCPQPPPGHTRRLVTGSSDPRPLSQFRDRWRSIPVSRK